MYVHYITNIYHTSYAKKSDLSADISSEVTMMHA